MSAGLAKTKEIVWQEKIADVAAAIGEQARASDGTGHNPKAASRGLAFNKQSLTARCKHRARYPVQGREILRGRDVPDGHAPLWAGGQRLRIPSPDREIARRHDRYPYFIC